MNNLMSMNIKLAKLFCSFICICLVISACSGADEIETGSAGSAGSEVSSSETQQSQRSKEREFDVGGVRVVSLPCITEVDNSMADLQKAGDQIYSEEFYKTAYFTTGSIGGVSNKLSVGVAVADLSTVRIIAEKLENPSVLSVSGTAKILEGE